MLSIVIPVLNQHEMTNECMEAIAANTRDCEIIIIDNGSNPPFKGPNAITAEYFSPLTGYPITTIIRNETNTGFPCAVNQGIKQAKGNYIVLLNNDVIVTENWFERLEWHLLKYDIIGPVTNYCAGMQRVIIPMYQDEKELNQRAIEFQVANAFQSQEVNFIIGFCMAFKRSLFDEIGQFDESMWPCSGEEVDFCFRAREKGHRIGIARDVYLHHEGSITFKEMHDKKLLDYNRICKTCDAHLAEKWGADFWQRQTIIASKTHDIVPDGAIRLNLGCGYAHIDGFVNIDNRPEVNPDMVCNVLEGLPYPDNSIDEVYALDFIEHLERLDVLKLMDEIYRVLKSNGRFYHRTPSDDGRGAWQDPYHKSAWNINTWRFYFSDPTYRKLYGTIANFKIIELRDEWTDKQNKILHTHCTYEAIKEEICMPIQ